MNIRPAPAADAAGIAALWNPVIADTAVTFTTEPKSVSGLAADIAARGPCFQEAARAEAVRSFWAGVGGENPAGIAFHRANGFDEIARLPEVGHKFGRWMDPVLMRKILREAAPGRPDRRRLVR